MSDCSGKRWDSKTGKMSGACSFAHSIRKKLLNFKETGNQKVLSCTSFYRQGFNHTRLGVSSKLKIESDCSCCLFFSILFQLLVKKGSRYNLLFSFFCCARDYSPKCFIYIYIRTHTWHMKKTSSLSDTGLLLSLLSQLLELIRWKHFLRHLI